MPERIQLRRTKGWQIPTGFVRITRPGAFGNPYREDDHGRDGCLDLFAALLARVDRSYTYTYRDGRTEPRVYPSDVMLLTALGGQGVACACTLDVACHGDLLLAHVEALGEGYDFEDGPGALA